MKRIKTQYPCIVYYEHKTRKHNGRPDRYFLLRYRFEGKQYELTGTAEEQYKRWRELLREIYLAETGFDQDVTPVGSETNGTESP